MATLRSCWPMTADPQTVYKLFNARPLPSSSLSLSPSSRAIRRARSRSRSCACKPRGQLRCRFGEFHLVRAGKDARSTQILRPTCILGAQNASLVRPSATELVCRVDRECEIIDHEKIEPMQCKSSSFIHTPPANETRSWLGWHLGSDLHLRSALEPKRESDNKSCPSAWLVGQLPAKNRTPCSSSQSLAR